MAGLEQRSKPAAYADFISSFPLGINSGLEPLLLEKHQLAFATNATVRGGYVSDRPPIFLQTLDFGGNTSLQSAVESGVFQGCGYYRPDYGTAQLIAQISGRLFAFTETGSVFVVTEISIPGDLNDPTVPHVWMWQSEKWLIVQDGTAALPIFYDGVTSRRSYGPSVILAEVTGPAGSPPGIGGVYTFTLTAPYTGPFNVPVLFNKEFYQPIANPTIAYDVVLTNVTAVSGNTEPDKSNLMVYPARIGFVVSNNSPITGFDNIRFVTCVLSSIQGLIVGSVVRFNGLTRSDGSIDSGTFTVTALDALTKTVTFHDNYYFGNPLQGPGGIHSGTFTISNGALVSLASGTAPNYLLGITTAPFVNPLVGNTVQITLDRPFAGPDGLLAWIGNEAYTVVGVPAPPANTVTLIDLTDASVAAYNFATDAKYIQSVPELPAGRMGCYGQGQTWQSGTDGQTFICSDPLGGASGTPANNYRDAVLKTTELTFRGGSFKIPNAGDKINAMLFGSTLDASLGQGPLQVGTDQGFFTVTAPLDFSTAPTATSPIATQALIGRGPLGQESTVQVNNDTVFRYSEGWGSLKMARAEFNTSGNTPSWSNTPISREVIRIIENDSKDLLSFGSAAVFDNRLIMAANPVTGPKGIYHVGLIAMNLDPLSNLRTKAPSCYDALWTGINTLQLVKGYINGSERGFSFVYDIGTNTIQLYELTLTGKSHFDYNGQLVRIQWSIETPIIFNKDVHDLTELLKLRDGELYLRDLIPGALLTVQVEYRPDFYPCWVPWRTFQLCAKDVDTDSQPGYRMRVGLGEPDPLPCEEGNNRPLRTGYFFQLRLTFTGHCNFMGARIAAVQEPQPQFAPPECNAICDTELQQLLVTT